MFYFAKINDKTVLKSDLIKAEHFFTTRESFIKTKESDFEETVKRNRQDICNFLKIKDSELLSPSQTHSSNIEVARKGKVDYPDTDGLILKDEGLAIFLNFADCTPLIFYDEVKNIGAVSHAGWRGTASNIATKTILKLKNEFGCSVDNISAVIGPAISYCCYNVGDEVIEKLRKTVDDFSGLSEFRNGEVFVDLKGINARQIKECGVSKIDVAPYCTSCDNNLFFSYRKENGTTNRHSAVLKL
jgi:YfiH family protein